MWGLGGKMMYWLSNKNGMKNLSRGSQTDVYAMFFDQKAWDRFILSKEDLELKEEEEKKDSSKTDKKDSVKAKKTIDR